MNRRHKNSLIFRQIPPKFLSVSMLHIASERLSEELHIIKSVTKDDKITNSRQKQRVNVGYGASSSNYRIMSIVAFLLRERNISSLKPFKKRQDTSLERYSGGNNGKAFQQRVTVGGSIWNRRAVKPFSGNTVLPEPSENVMNPKVGGAYRIVCRIKQSPR